MKTIIIIPAYNEEKNIELVVENLIKNYPQYDYVVINDCSTDKTREILKQKNYNFIDLPVNLGIGGGVQTGYKYALENNYDIAIQMDGDGQHNPQYYEQAVNMIKNNNADIVIGSRFIKKEGFQSSSIRRFGISFLSNLIKLICRADIKDVTSGYRIINKRFIEIYAREYAQDYPEPEAIVNAKINKAVIKEIPVQMNERLGGESSISPLKSIYYMIKVSIAIITYRITINKRGNK
jgi:glycosyltransferase involved in cell wall biosynthesis